MISQQAQVPWRGAVCNQTEVTNWQNVIPYGGTKRDNVVIIRSGGALTDKCNHGNCRKQKANKHCKSHVLNP
jgi:hypothetical protein